MLRNPDHLDLTIQVGPDQRIFRAHKDVLSIVSPYVKTACKSAFKEGFSNTFHFEDMHVETMTSILGYAYLRDRHIAGYTVCTETDEPKGKKRTWREPPRLAKITDVNYILRSEISLTNLERALELYTEAEKLQIHGLKSEAFDDFVLSLGSGNSKHFSELSWYELKDLLISVLENTSEHGRRTAQFKPLIPSLACGQI